MKNNYLTITEPTERTAVLSYERWVQMAEEPKQFVAVQQWCK